MTPTNDNRQTPASQARSGRLSKALQDAQDKPDQPEEKRHPYAIICNPEIDTIMEKCARRIYLGDYIHTFHTLKSHANKQKWGCFPSQETLAEETGHNERTVRNHLKKFIEWGLVKTKKVKTRTGLHNAYTFPMDYRLCPDSAPVVEEEKADFTTDDGNRKGHEVAGGDRKGHEIAGYQTPLTNQTDLASSDGEKSGKQQPDFSAPDHEPGGPESEPEKPDIKRASERIQMFDIRLQHHEFNHGIITKYVERAAERWPDYVNEAAQLLLRRLQEAYPDRDRDGNRQTSKGKPVEPMRMLNADYSPEDSDEKQTLLDHFCALLADGEDPELISVMHEVAAKARDDETATGETATGETDHQRDGENSETAKQPTARGEGVETVWADEDLQHLINQPPF